MDDSGAMQNIPWHSLHRKLAGSADTGSYAIVRKRTQPQWRFTPCTDSWLSRTRNRVGVGTTRSE